VVPDQVKVGVMKCVSNQMEGPYKNTYINSIFNYIRYTNFKCSLKNFGPPPQFLAQDTYI